jgi:hypothetical protein
VLIGIKTILYEAAKYNVYIVGVWRKANLCGFEAGYMFKEEELTQERSREYGQRRTRKTRRSIDVHCPAVTSCTEGSC